MFFLKLKRCERMSSQISTRKKTCTLFDSAAFCAMHPKVTCPNTALKSETRQISKIFIATKF